MDDPRQPPPVPDFCPGFCPGFLGTIVPKMGTWIVTAGGALALLAWGGRTGNSLVALAGLLLPVLVWWLRRRRG